MAQFTKKPVTIEAVQFMGVSAIGEPLFESHRGKDRPDWLRDALNEDQREPGAIYLGEGWKPAKLMVFSREGILMADVGDWIVRGVEGEVYPVKPGIFAKTYHAVEA